MSLKRGSFSCGRSATFSIPQMDIRTFLLGIRDSRCCLSKHFIHRPPGWLASLARAYKIGRLALRCKFLAGRPSGQLGRSNGARKSRQSPSPSLAIAKPPTIKACQGARDGRAFLFPSVRGGASTRGASKRMPHTKGYTCGNWAIFPTQYVAIAAPPLNVGLSLNLSFGRVVMGVVSPQRGGPAGLLQSMTNDAGWQSGGRARGRHGD